MTEHAKNQFIDELTAVICKKEFLFIELFEIAQKTNNKIHEIVGVLLNDDQPFKSKEVWIKSLLKNEPPFQNFVVLCHNHRFLVDEYYLPYVFTALLNPEFKNGGFLYECVIFLRAHRNQQLTARQVDKKKLNYDYDRTKLNTFIHLFRLEQQFKILAQNSSASKILSKLKILPNRSLFHLLFILNQCEPEFDFAGYMKPLPDFVRESLSGNDVWSISLETYFASLCELTYKFKSKYPYKYDIFTNTLENIMKGMNVNERSLLFSLMSDQFNYNDIIELLDITQFVVNENSIWLVEWLKAVPKLRQINYSFKDFIEWINKFRELDPSDITTSGTKVPRRLLRAFSNENTSPKSIDAANKHFDQVYQIVKKLGVYPGACWLKIYCAVCENGKSSSIGVLYTKINEIIDQHQGAVGALVLSQLSKSRPRRYLTPGWFDLLDQVLLLSPKAVYWITSDDALISIEEEEIRFAQNWFELCFRLSLKLPRNEKYIPLNWKFSDKDRKLIRNEIALWEHIETSGISQIYSWPKKSQIFKVDPETEWRITTTIAKSSFWAEVLKEAANHGEFNGTLDFDDIDDNLPKHPLLLGIKSRNIQNEITQLMQANKRQEIIDLSGFEHARYRPNLPELITCLDKMDPENFKVQYILDLGEDIINRYEKICPNLGSLYTQLGRLSPHTPDFNEVRAAFASEENLRWLCPGFSNTGCCTDGPDGSKAIYGLSAAIHKKADKIYFEYPHPELLWENPTIFGTIWLYEVAYNDKRTILVDSIEFGADAYRIKNYQSILGAAIFEFLRQNLVPSDFYVIFNESFYNLIGQEIYQHMKKYGKYGLISRQLDINIDCEDLIDLGVETIYIESNTENEEVCIPKDRKYINIQSNFDLIVQ